MISFSRLKRQKRIKENKLRQPYAKYIDTGHLSQDFYSKNISESISWPKKLSLGRVLILTGGCKFKFSNITHSLYT